MTDDRQLRPDEPGATQWSARYDGDDTPWDLGRAHPELGRRLADDATLGTGVVGRVLVPGCGRGHDAGALAEAGWDVFAVDIAPSVAETVAATLAPHGGRFAVVDLLDVAALDEFLGGEPVDLVFDHTLFCAIPPRLRPAFGDVCDRVLSEAGGVISIVFPIGRDHAEGGPPWGMAPDHVDDALGGGFRRVETSEEIRVAGRSWAHRWCRWTRSDSVVDSSGQT